MLRVATYNIRKCVGLDWRRRPDRVMEVIAELRADVIALQEADRRFGTRVATLPITALAARTGLTAVTLPVSAHSSGHHGNAILVAQDADVRCVRLTELPSLEPRGAVIADLTLREQPLRIVAVHLGLRKANRIRQAETLLNALQKLPADGPTIVMGDLNQWAPRGGAVAALSRVYRPSQPLPSFHTSMPVAPLDRILIGDGLAFRHVAVHRSALALRASDHLPLVADLDRTQDSDHPKDQPLSKELQ